MKSSQPAGGRTAVRGRTIALFGTGLYYDLPISIFRTTREILHKADFNLLYFVTPAYETTNFIGSRTNILYNLVTPRITDGIIIISNLLGSFSTLPDFREFCLRFHPQPVVSMGMAIKGIPSVILDNTAGMYEAVCHLIEVHHYSRIAFLSGPPEHSDVKDRFAGFIRAMENHGLPVDENLLIEGTFVRDSGITAVKELLDNRGKIPGEDVQAIVCCNDYMATGVMVELQRRGIRIPDQIAITGFDDINLSGCLVPPLSTVQYPFSTLTAKAIELMMKLIAGETIPEVVPVRAQFIPRHSCGCPDSLDHDGKLLLTEELEKLLENASFKYPDFVNKHILKIGGPTLMAWKQALTHLRLKGKLDLHSLAANRSLQTTTGSFQEVEASPGQLPPPIDKAEGNEQIAWELLGTIAYTTFHNTDHQSVIHHMENALISTQELPKLTSILADLLPQADIKRCCFCLYENSGDHLNKTAGEPEQLIKHSLGALPPRSRLVLSFNQDGPLELPPGGILFATLQLLPEEIIRKQGWESWVILPLYIKQEQFGYMLLDSDAPHEHLYRSICSQVSGTLMGIRLLEETRKANEQKTQFFINVAHETKTPLTLIKNYLSLYMEQHQSDEQLEVIEQNINMLLKNMLNFLDVEKLQQGQTLYRHDALVNLSESAYKKCTLFGELAKKKSISLKVNAEKDILIRIDPLALDRILNNLLDNAVKYIQQGGQIAVEVRRSQGNAILRICDNGPGLPVETFDHIFEPYYLLSQKKTDKQGIGVGLSIVKKIIDGLGAGIMVEKCRGGGICFTISFADSSTVQPGESLQTIPDTAPSLPVTISIKERNISAEKPALLVVDDNVQLLQFMQTSLEKKYSVYLAGDVPEALFKLRTIPRPALIIADIMMDGADGFTLLKKIYTKEKYNNIPFIFLTAMGGEKQRIRGLDLGAVDYIEKPFSILEISSKIDSLIALRKRQEKQDIKDIKNRIQGLFSTVEQDIDPPKKPNFEANCQAYGITEREMTMLRLLLKGLLYKEIAANLNISLRTVEYNISRIYKKCNVTNKFELIRKFIG